MSADQVSLFTLIGFSSSFSSCSLFMFDSDGNELARQNQTKEGERVPLVKEEIVVSVLHFVARCQDKQLISNRRNSAIEVTSLLEELTDFPSACESSFLRPDWTVCTVSGQHDRSTVNSSEQRTWQ